MPVTARLEGGVGGNLDHQDRLHVGDRHLPAAEVTAADLGRPRVGGVRAPR